MSDVCQQLRDSVVASAQARETPEAREGLAAFLEKRPPVWQPRARLPPLRKGDVSCSGKPASHDGEGGEKAARAAAYVARRSPYSTGFRVIDRARSARRTTGISAVE